MVNELNELQQICINMGISLAIKMIKDIPEEISKEELIIILSGYLNNSIQALKGDCYE